MYVDYSGWSEEKGFFAHKIFIDEKRQDYEIEYGNGTVAYQKTPFHEVTGDWNNDGDVYTLFGAFFEIPGENRGIFFSPEDMVSAMVEALDRTRKPYGNEVVKVKDVEIPRAAHKVSLDEQIRQHEQRAANQEADRNRKMDAFGIRRPDEPWAR